MTNPHLECHQRKQDGECDFQAVRDFGLVQEEGEEGEAYKCEDGEQDVP